MKKNPEYKQLDLSGLGKEIRTYWDVHETFRKSIEMRDSAPQYVFYEGPSVREKVIHQNIS